MRDIVRTRVLQDPEFPRVRWRVALRGRLQWYNYNATFPRWRTLWRDDSSWTRSPARIALWLDLALNPTDP